MRLHALTIFTGLAVASLQAAPTLWPGDPSPNVMQAAREVQRYVYLRSGTLLPIAEPPAVVSGEAIRLDVDKALAADEVQLRTAVSGGHKVLLITGGSGSAVRYGAYRFAERLGVRFYPHGDVIPDTRTPFAIPDLDEKHQLLSGPGLPDEARVVSGQLGAPRLVVPTVRTVARRGEAVRIDVIVLDRQPPRTIALRVRNLGGGDWQEVPLALVSRATYTATLPPLGKDTVEYYLEAHLAAGETLRWPATAPEINQTIVSIENELEAP